MTRRSVLLAVALLISGCGRSESEEGRGISIGVSLAPQRWLVEQVGGERIEAFELVRAGESPATYQPTDQQVTRLLRSALYLRVGAPFESSPWFDAIKSSGRVRIVDLRQGITLRTIARHHHDPSHADDPHSSSGQDPHIWLSPRNLEVQARTVTEALIGIDAGNAPEYRANLGRLEQRLRQLDHDLRQILEPIAGKPFFVFHPAWGYFADEYDLREVAIEVEGKEPSDRELTELQQKALAEGVQVIFVQPQISGRTAEAVARAIGGRLEILDPLAYDVAANLRRVAGQLSASE